MAPTWVRQHRLFGGSGPYPLEDCSLDPQDGGMASQSTHRRQRSGWMSRARETVKGWECPVLPAQSKRNVKKVRCSAAAAAQGKVREEEMEGEKVKERSQGSARAVVGGQAGATAALMLSDRRGGSVWMWYGTGIGQSRGERIREAGRQVYSVLLYGHTVQYQHSTDKLVEAPTGGKEGLKKTRGPPASQ